MQSQLSNKENKFFLIAKRVFFHFDPYYFIKAFSFYFFQIEWFKLL
jgi:hypothetical protein